MSLPHRALAAALLAAALVAGPCNPAGAGVLALGDDDTVEVAFDTGFTFPFFGTHYRSAWVNSNGSLTFGRGDISSLWSEDAFLEGPPRLAPLWADLTPDAAGAISTASSPSSFTATWSGVPVFGEPGGNSFSITLHEDGSFTCHYDVISTSGGIAGYSGGPPLEPAGTPAVDLSAEVQPLGNGSRAAVHESFGPGSGIDLAGTTLAFRATWDRFRFYGADTSVADLLNVNGWTGAARPIGPLGFPSVEGLTFAPDGTLYGVDMGGFPQSAVLVRIDPVTGAATAVGPLGYTVIKGLAAAEDGTLYGVEMDPDAEETNLLFIDPGSGAATPVAAMTSTDITALAFTTDGTLWAVDDDTDHLLTVDPVTAAETVVGPLGHDGVSGLAAAPDGRLFAVRRELVIGEGFHSLLMEVDTVTGSARETGPLGPSSAGGLAARCEPTNGGTELCDGLDNDCSGAADEPFPGLGGPCTSGLGQCARDGLLQCSLDGTASACSATPGEPSEEVCNGLDDDCNDIVEDDLDVDGDGVSICGGDCDDSARGSISVPGEVSGVRFTRDWIVWEDLAPESGPATRYQVVVALDPSLGDAQCLEGGIDEARFPDTIPPPGAPSVMYYLVRAGNDCGTGPLGADSGGEPRPGVVEACP